MEMPLRGAAVAPVGTSCVRTKAGQIEWGVLVIGTPISSRGLESRARPMRSNHNTRIGLSLDPIVGFSHQAERALPTRASRAFLAVNTVRQVQRRGSATKPDSTQPAFALSEAEASRKLGAKARPRAPADEVFYRRALRDSNSRPSVP
jgi:hypothetical protein